jgi:hypothetical protein
MRCRLDSFVSLSVIVAGVALLIVAWAFWSSLRVEPMDIWPLLPERSKKYATGGPDAHIRKLAEQAGVPFENQIEPSD